MKRSVSREPEWMVVLRADIVASGSISKTAQRIGVSRSSISQILNGCGGYGTGLVSTAKVVEKVMKTISTVACPFLTEQHGAERRITRLECRAYAECVNPSTNSPQTLRHWRACQGCEKRVVAAKPASEVTPRKQAAMATLAAAGAVGKPVQRVQARPHPKKKDSHDDHH